MKPVELKKDIYWVGIVDWNCRDFHGYSLSPMGTTYNAFLVKDEKIALVDTAKADHAGEFFCALSHLVKPEDVDYLIVNHLEPDHSGALVEAVQRCKPEKIFCSPMGARSLAGLYQTKDWPIEVIKSGGSISLGKRSVTFLETRMLHWPDSMFSYIPEDKVVFSSDAFGQNWATSERFADQVGRETLDRVLSEYFANIVQPYSPVVLKTLDKIAELKLELDMILPDHGLLLRGEDCAWVLKRYREMAEAKPKPRAVLVYDTMWQSTEQMIHAVSDGLKDEGIETRIMHVKANHHSAIMTELLDSGALVVGSPTHNNGILPYMAGLFQYMKGLKPLNKVGGAVGSFGWSGECVPALNEWLEKIGIEVVGSGVKQQWRPTHDTLKACVAYGREIGAALKAKIAALG